jgi:hypothetical protein
MEQVINYVVDRIYCESELSGNPEKGILQGIVKLEELINNHDYDISSDTNSDGNNILHLIAQCGLYEFYERIKNHKDFHKIKNVPNDNNMTPCDIALARPRIFNGLFAIVFQNPMIIIPIMVTSSYYNKSISNLLDAMMLDNLVSTRSKKENTKLFFQKFAESNPEFWKVIDETFDNEEKRTDS